jgi:hypothetical protein
VVVLITAVIISFVILAIDITIKAGTTQLYKMIIG